MTKYFFEVEPGSKFLYGGIEYIKTDKLARNAFRVSDGVAKYFYLNTQVEVIE